MHVPHEDAYLESRVYSATPAELIHILYEAALDAVREAVRAHEAGLVAERARSIGKATSCVMELAGSLNVSVGGELGVRLAVLYEYLLHQLLEASTSQSASALESCQQVLTALWEGWGQAMQQMPVSAGDGSLVAADLQPPASSHEREWKRADPEDDAVAPRLREEHCLEERVSWCA